MKKLTQISLASMSALALIGCGDSYSSTSSNTPSSSSSLSTSTRSVKHLVDTAAMTLYTFDKDALNKSNCDAKCQEIWPLFIGNDTGSADIKVLEGSNHLSYRKHPLYYFIKDNVPGDILGNNIKEVWHLVFAPKGSNDSQTTFSDETIKQVYLTDKDGRSLYTFDKDEKGVSNCYDSSPTSGEGCESVWPVFYSSDLGTLPTGTKASDFSIINRDKTKAKNGEPLQQVSYKGKPLYYFTPDAKIAGSTKGDWVKGVWHLVELSSTKSENTTATSPYTADAVAKGRAIFTNPSKCSRCHGADGQTPPLGIDNVIARYGDATLITQKLKDLRDNGNPQGRSDIMVGIASKLSDEAIINLSAFVATLKK